MRLWPRISARSRLLNRRSCAWLFTMMLVLGGCAGGSMKSSPDNPTSAGGLAPNIEDKEAGLVAIAPGFDIRQYRAILVERVAVAPREMQDEAAAPVAAAVTIAL